MTYKKFTPPVVAPTQKPSHAGSINGTAKTYTRNSGTVSAAAAKPAQPPAPATQNVTKLTVNPKPTTNLGTKPMPTSRQDIDAHLKNLTQLVEKDPQKAAEVFKSWLDRPSKIVKSKRAA